ncbi:MAG: hypothetical protein M0R80_27620 [Proteobacteria bacterium]|jgi:hypothetical protein|nr:hypothetical protein [Pseudomonadota bacterium]
MKQKWALLDKLWETSSYEEMAQETGYSAEYIRKWGAKHGKPHKRLNAQSKPRKGVIQQEELMKLIKNKRLSVVEVANHFDVAPQKAVEAIQELKKQRILFDVVNDGVRLSNELQPPEKHSIDFTRFKEVEYPIGFTADNHINSKYERMDVLESLFDRFKAEGVEVVYQGGNMIDGEARFNKFDIYKYGIEDQVQNFVDLWPKREGIRTEFITGDDHEGWYVQREHINIGQKIEDEAKRAGRTDLIHLGYMEKDIEYTQAGGSSRLRVIHAGGGSSYATSYTSQKYVETLQGGEKPSICLVGHFHKLDYAYPREVHMIQMGCTEDQTPFMRKKRLQAHIGGGILWVKQNELGIFTSVKVQFIPFFDKKYYAYQW